MLEMPPSEMTKLTVREAAHPMDKRQLHAVNGAQPQRGRGWNPHQDYYHSQLSVSLKQIYTTCDDEADKRALGKHELWRRTKLHRWANSKRFLHHRLDSFCYSRQIGYGWV
jgi:hypothetical protein